MNKFFLTAPNKIFLVVNVKFNVCQLLGTSSRKLALSISSFQGIKHIWLTDINIKAPTVANSVHEAYLLHELMIPNYNCY